MPLFETILVLLFVTIGLLQVSRRLGTPYPSLLALAGVGVGLVPGVPYLEIEPQLALALFVAPVLLDAAYDTDPREMRRNWVPLASLVCGAVVLTTAVVAVAGHTLGALPWGAAIALGAIVAPPDAAAASAVLRQFRLPRRTLTILQDESLLNDAVALLIFGAAVSATVASGSGAGHAAPLWRLAFAVPGGAAFGWVAARLYVRIYPVIAGTMGSLLLQFTSTYAVWVAAEHLDLSPILAVVAYGITLAQRITARTSARERVHSYSVWAVVVFLLNVLAFLIMGMQARGILARLSAGDLWRDLTFAGVVLVLVVLARFAWIATYRRVVGALRLRAVVVPTGAQVLLGSWCGMRGIVTLATAFALPEAFPGRDRIALCAFAVVRGTLIAQGLTLKWLIDRLGIEPDPLQDEEVATARAALLDTAFSTLDGRDDEEARVVRLEYERARNRPPDSDQPQDVTDLDRVRIEVITAQRQVLEDLRHSGQITEDTYHLLEAELDWRELAATPNEQLELQDT